MHASAGGYGPIQSVEGAVGQQHWDTMTSSVTAAWGAKWNEKMIACDIMQNLFDASRDPWTSRLAVTNPTGDASIHIHHVVVSV